MVGQIKHHLYRKRGFCYFCRRVPKTLLKHYPKHRIVVALKTRHFSDALRQSQILTKHLDDEWFHMQLDAMGLDNVQARIFQPVKQPNAPLVGAALWASRRLIEHDSSYAFPSYCSHAGCNKLCQYCSRDCFQTINVPEKGFVLSSFGKGLQTEVIYQLYVGLSVAPDAKTTGNSISTPCPYLLVLEIFFFI